MLEQVCDWYYLSESSWALNKNLGFEELVSEEIMELTYKYMKERIFLMATKNRRLSEENIGEDLQ